VLTWLEDLPMINHYCFAGKQSFQNGFRALVAGGGTGDATIFLAEQLRHTDAQVVHLDMSTASIALAKERAQIRGLTNITWVHDSLLNLPALAASSESSTTSTAAACCTTWPTPTWASRRCRAC
jgi:ubiquinone/menaquinone biosynthesis C-methylase UbiE